MWSFGNVPPRLQRSGIELRVSTSRPSCAGRWKVPSDEVDRGGETCRTCAKSSPIAYRCSPKKSPQTAKGDDRGALKWIHCVGDNPEGGHRHSPTRPSDRVFGGVFSMKAGDWQLLDGGSEGAGKRWNFVIRRRVGSIARQCLFRHGRRLRSRPACTIDCSNSGGAGSAGSISPVSA